MRESVEVVPPSTRVLRRYNRSLLLSVAGIRDTLIWCSTPRKERRTTNVITSHPNVERWTITCTYSICVTRNTFTWIRCDTKYWHESTCMRIWGVSSFYLVCPCEEAYVVITLFPATLREKEREATERVDTRRSVFSSSSFGLPLILFSFNLAHTCTTTHTITCERAMCAQNHNVAYIPCVRYSSNKTLRVVYVLFSVRQLSCTSARFPSVTLTHIGASKTTFGLTRVAYEREFDENRWERESERA